jgi:hypothetical protein
MVPLRHMSPLGITIKTNFGNNKLIVSGARLKRNPHQQTQLAAVFS